MSVCKERIIAINCFFLIGSRLCFHNMRVDQKGVQVLLFEVPNSFKFQVMLWSSDLSPMYRRSPAVAVQHFDLFMKILCHSWTGMVQDTSETNAKINLGLCHCPEFTRQITHKMHMKIMQIWNTTSLFAPAAAWFAIALYWPHLCGCVTKFVMCNIPNCPTLCFLFVFRCFHENLVFIHVSHSLLREWFTSVQKKWWAEYH